MKVSRDYRLTIPFRIRRELGMLPGTEVEFEIDGNEIYLVKVEKGRRNSKPPKKERVQIMIEGRKNTD